MLYGVQDSYVPYVVGEVLREPSMIAIFIRADDEGLSPVNFRLAAEVAFYEIFPD